MDVSVIIVNYNTLQMTQECIDSVFEKTKDINFEVILVDNASTDGSKEHFKKDKRIKYIYSSENLGFGRANNLGYKYAIGKYIFLLNSDTLLLNDAICEFFTYMESSPSDVGCVGCELVDKEGSPSYSFGYFPNFKFFLGKILEVYRLHFAYLSFTPFSVERHPIKVDYSSGADMFIRRSVLEDCGFFDEDFFMYFEEVELQHRFSNQGYFSFIIDTPKIVHLMGGSNPPKKTKKSLKIKTIELESRFIYCRKLFPFYKYAGISFLHLLMIPRILFYNSLLKEKVLMIRIILRNLFPNDRPSMFI